MTLYDDVRRFHQRFDLPHYGEGARPHLLSVDEQEFRLKFLIEELKEFSESYAAADLVGAADALCDLVYVALGTAHMMHLPFNELWREVQWANMQKERASGDGDDRSKRRHRLDVVKPEGWRPPDLRRVLRETSGAVEP